MYGERKGTACDRGHTASSVKFGEIWWKQHYEWLAVELDHYCLLTINRRMNVAG